MLDDENLDQYFYDDKKEIPLYKLEFKDGSVSRYVDVKTVYLRQYR